MKTVTRDWGLGTGQSALARRRSLRIEVDSWRIETRTGRGIPFIAERALRTPRALPSYARLFSRSTRREPVRDAALWIGCTFVITALLAAGFMA